MRKLDNVWNFKSDDEVWFKNVPHIFVSCGGNVGLMLQEIVDWDSYMSVSPDDAIYVSSHEDDPEVLIRMKENKTPKLFGNNHQFLIQKYGKGNY